MGLFNFFSQKEKRKHYSAVANGEKPVKKDSKFTEAEQVAYAKGQRDARNESARICAAKNATPEQRAEYRARRKAARAAYKAQKAAKKSNKPKTSKSKGKSKTTVKRGAYNAVGKVSENLVDDTHGAVVFYDGGKLPF